jgi:hypothetical protein
MQPMQPMQPMLPASQSAPVLFQAYPGGPVTFMTQQMQARAACGVFVFVFPYEDSSPDNKNNAL